MKKSSRYVFLSNYDRMVSIDDNEYPMTDKVDKEIKANKQSKEKQKNRWIEYTSNTVTQNKQLS